MAKREEFDVCVIGTGAGGGVMIHALTAAGFKVVALERGQHRTVVDFTDDELGNLIRRSSLAPHQLESYRADAEAPSGLAFRDLRMLFATLDSELHAIAGRAVQIVEWDRTHQFCGACGKST